MRFVLGIYSFPTEGIVNWLKKPLLAAVDAALRTAYDIRHIYDSFHGDTVTLPIDTKFREGEESLNLLLQVDIT